MIELTFANHHATADPPQSQTMHTKKKEVKSCISDTTGLR